MFIAKDILVFEHDIYIGHNKTFDGKVFDECDTRRLRAGVIVKANTDDVFKNVNDWVIKIDTNKDLEWFDEDKIRDRAIEALSEWKSTYVHENDGSILATSGTHYTLNCGSVVVRGVAEVHAHGKGFVFSYDSTKVTAYDSVIVVAAEYSHVRATDHSVVRAFDHSSVHASNHSRVEADDDTYVYACGNAQISTGDRANVKAGGYATIMAHSYSSIDAEESATVVLPGQGEEWKNIRISGNATKTSDGWRYLSE